MIHDAINKQANYDAIENISDNYYAIKQTNYDAINNISNKYFAINKQAN